MAEGQRAGRDPTRRNRNQGTKARGFKKDSTFGVPWRWRGRDLFDVELGDHVVVERWVEGRLLFLIVERPRHGFRHACTPDEIAAVLGMLPGQCVKGPEPLTCVALLQPTAKKDILEGAWGSLRYNASIGRFRGPAIVLYAASPSERISWPKKRDVELQAEEERMAAILPVAEHVKGRPIFEFGLEGLRRWLLYHTLIHEAGHWMDYRSKVIWPDHRNEPEPDNVPEDTNREGRYFQRPNAEREAFAHRFSDEWRDELVHRGWIPMVPSVDRDQMKSEGLEPEWFAAAEGPCPMAARPVQTVLERRRRPMFHLLDWREFR